MDDAGDELASTPESGGCGAVWGVCRRRRGRGAFEDDGLGETAQTGDGAVGHDAALLGG
jgi:hypothetical protein